MQYEVYRPQQWAVYVGGRYFGFIGADTESEAQSRAEQWVGTTNAIVSVALIPF
jgi:hypothetical protein